MMTVKALLKLSGKELEEWYHGWFNSLAKGEAITMEQGGHDAEKWGQAYRGADAMFREAVDLKFKLEIIKHLESLS